MIRGIEKPLVTGWDGYRAYELNVATLLAAKRKATSVYHSIQPPPMPNAGTSWTTKQSHNTYMKIKQIETLRLPG